MMYCVFALRADEKFKFVFGETHLKAKPPNMGKRVEQANIIKNYYAEHFPDIPAFIAGDFNEEPHNEPIA